MVRERYSPSGTCGGEAEAQEAGARGGGGMGAAVTVYVIHMVSATMCLKAAGPSLRMFREVPLDWRWNIWGGSCTEGSDVGKGVIFWASLKWDLAEQFTSRTLT